MSKITRFEPGNLQAIRHDFDMFAKAIAEKYGIGMKMAKITYDALSFRCKIEAAILGKDNVTGAEIKYATEAADFQRNAFMFGLSKEDLGRVVTYAGGSWKIIGSQSRRHKFPILMQNMSNPATVKLFPEDTVKFAVEMAKAKKDL